MVNMEKRDAGMGNVWNDGMNDRQELLFCRMAMVEADRVGAVREPPLHAPGVKRENRVNPARRPNE
jgi:hypothetical protein